MSDDVTGHQGAHSYAWGQVGRITICIEGNITFEGISRTPALVDHEVDPVAALAVKIDKGSLGGPIGKALKVDSDLVLLGRSSVNRTVLT